jgi:hypothetical protein
VVRAARNGAPALGSVVAVVALALLLPAPAWADHPVPGMRTASWHPLTAALVFGGLALVAGLLVVVVVTLLTRRPPRDDAGG